MGKIQGSSRSYCLERLQAAKVVSQNTLLNVSLGGMTCTIAAGASPARTLKAACNVVRFQWRQHFLVSWLPRPYFFFHERLCPFHCFLFFGKCELRTGHFLYVWNSSLKENS